MLVNYLPEKPGLPPAWFGIGQALRDNPDFVALAPGSLDELARDRTWLEWKGLRQIREVFAEALKTMPEMAHVVAIETRYVGEAALAARDGEVARARSEVHEHVPPRGAQRARRAHRLQRAEPVPPARRGDAARPAAALALDGLRRSRRTSSTTLSSRTSMGLGFVAETAAYDLCALCEVACEHGSRRATIGCSTIFLEIDKEAEDDTQERALRGVRKAQAKLAAYYLLRGMTRPARARSSRTWRRRRPSGCARSATSCSRSRRKDFWEVTDRGTNFDYVDDARKTHVRQFFDWFPELGEAGASASHRVGPPGRWETPLIPLGPLRLRLCAGGVVLALAALLLPALGGLGGCAGGLKYTVDDATLDPVPATDRAGVLEARKEQDLATTEQRLATGAMEKLDRELEVANNEKEQARLEIEKAVAEQEGAKASRDENQANAAARNKNLADMGLKVAEAKLAWLQQKKDWLKQSSVAANAHVEAAKAHVELEKAKVAQHRGMKPSSDFQVSDYEGQWKSRHSSWQSEKKDAESEEDDARNKEASWKQMQTQLQKMKG